MRLPARDVVFEFPLRAQTPVSFGVTDRDGQSTIIFPLESWRFINDVSLLGAWFSVAGCGGAPILAMWSYLHDALYLQQSAEPPFEAFGLDREAVLQNEDAQDYLGWVSDDMRTFILAHEYGHVALGHDRDLPLEALRDQEWEADRFALEHFLRLERMPIGLLQYLVIATYAEPHPDDIDALTHPPTTERALAALDFLSEHALALSNNLTDPPVAAAELRDRIEIIRTLIVEVAPTDPTPAAREALGDYVRTAVPKESWPTLCPIAE